MIRMKCSKNRFLLMRNKNPSHCWSVVGCILIRSSSIKIQMLQQIVEIKKEKSFAMTLMHVYNTQV